MRFYLPIFLTLALAFQQVGYNEQDYRSLTDSVILKKPRSFEDLDRLFNQYSNDTTVLNLLNLKSRRTNYAEGLVYAKAHLGLFLQEAESYQIAHDQLIQALRSSDQTQDPDYRVFVLTRLASLHQQTDSLRTALFYNQDALAIIDSLETYSPTILLAKRDAEIQLGQLYRTIQRPEEALHYFALAVDSELLMETPVALADIYVMMGQTLEDQDRFNEAVLHYRKARLSAEDIGNKPVLYKAVLLIANNYLLSDRQAEASELLETLPDSLGGDLELELLQGITMGHLLSKTGQFRTARSVLEENLEKSADHPEFLAETYLRLSELEEAAGDSQKALVYFAAYDELEEKIRAKKQTRFLQNAVIPYNPERRKSELQLLTERNELNKLRLRRNQNTFLITGLLFALLTLVLYIIYRQYQLRNERKVMALEQTMLRSQMNPHFLFNSLNSIKHYIINNEQKNAVHYLNKFSKLVRRILEASSARETTLAEELETADLYMGIENIRFSYEIEFDVQLDQNVDPDHIRIPSLILQPFLENALWHGLSSKKGDKKIVIHVQRLNPQLIGIDITDNGVGRAASEKLKESRVVKRKSLGIDITKERLENFAKDYQNDFSITIEDLEKDGAPIGTRVALQIPTS